MGGVAERGLQVLAGVVELGPDILLRITVCGQLSLDRDMYMYNSLQCAERSLLPQAKISSTAHVKNNTRGFVNIGLTLVVVFKNIWPIFELNQTEKNLVVKVDFSVTLKSMLRP